MGIFSGLFSSKKSQAPKEEVKQVEPQCGIVKPIEEQKGFNYKKMSPDVPAKSLLGFHTGKWYYQTFIRKWDGQESKALAYIVDFRGAYGYSFGFDFDGMFDENLTLIELNDNLWHEAEPSFVKNRMEEYNNFLAGKIKSLPVTIHEKTAYKSGLWYGGVRGANKFKVNSYNFESGKYDVQYFGKYGEIVYKEIDFDQRFNHLTDNEVRINLYTNAVKRGFVRKDLSYENGFLKICDYVIFNGSCWNEDIATKREASTLCGLIVL